MTKNYLTVKSGVISGAPDNSYCGGHKWEKGKRREGREEGDGEGEKDTHKLTDTHT